MGADIHCFVEQKMYRSGIYETDRTGKWISIDKWTKNDWAILYPEKNYPVWLINEIPKTCHISEPRGLPEDVTPEIRLQIRNSECHTMTWFAAEEMLAFNWNQVFHYEDETMNGEKIIETVDYAECGKPFLAILKRLVGGKNPSDIRLIIAFDN